MEFPNSPTRSRPVHPEGVAVGDRSTVYFVTVCTENRVRVLDNDDVHGLIRSGWKNAEDFLVGRYVIMPDHVHFFCTPGISSRTISLKRWISFWKSWTANRWIPGKGKLWQSNFWDRQLRAGDSYSAKWQYVRDNPVRAGLVAESNVWPYQGEMNEFSWSD